MQLNKIRRMAAEILKVGKTKIVFSEKDREKIAESMTKEDVRQLIKDGIVKKRKDNYQSKARARKLKEKKIKGRKRGKGKRKGTIKARTNKKKAWMKKVRAQRKKLKELKNEGKMEKGQYGKIYRMIKGNYFKGKKYVEAAVKGDKK
ncbi:50S ribosomal protein L19e [Candidatus Micrarchaeota archaeon]|nr:50S ribosomal protein L19e [Candidatus Micrarchaeota archaeon]MBU2475901.1 50S ribosomal protein L19e [Candidatus Micrarchaeota archaeon]